MRKIMISQPMRGKTDLEIKEIREKAETELNQIFEDEGCQIVETYFEEEWCSKETLEKKGVENIPIFFLAKSLEKMSEADTVYFCKGWQDAPGCVIEHTVALSYHLLCVYEQEQ